MNLFSLYKDFRSVNKYSFVLQASCTRDLSLDITIYPSHQNIVLIINVQYLNAFHFLKLKKKISSQRSLSISHIKIFGIPQTRKDP